MEYNNSTYITLLTTHAELLGISENNRKSNNGTITIIEYSENETIPQEVINVVINTMTHQQALELVETNEWKSNIII
jgi:hypothetical protein